MPKETTRKPAGKSNEAPAVKKTAARKVATKKVATKKTATRKTTAKKTARKESLTTMVIAKIDAGYGNEIYIRGGGAGLSWNSGTLMENTGSDKWTWKSKSVGSELEFKVLLNDTVWSVGANGVIFPGATVVFQPEF